MLGGVTRMTSELPLMTCNVNKTTLPVSLVVILFEVLLLHLASLNLLTTS